MSPRPSPCDGHAGQLAAYLDREIEPAATQALEGHLERCAACQGRLRELEAVSDVLRGWDAPNHLSAGAQSRLAHAVLARIEREGARRAGEARRGRARALALAAGVLLALGGSAALGALARARPSAPADGGSAQAAAAARPAPALRLAALPPAPAPAALPPTLLARSAAPSAPSSQAPGEVAAAPTLLPPEERAPLADAVLPAQLELVLEARAQARYGVRCTFVTDAPTGRRLLLTAEAAAWLADPEGRLADLRRQLAEPRTQAAPRPPRDLGLTLSAVVTPLLPAGEAAGGAPRAPAVYHFGEPGTERHLLQAFALAPPEGAAASAPTRRVALDPLAAAADGRLRLAETDADADALVAIVEGTALPILLPAGQLLTGGVTDRVVARSVWLPASAGRTVWQVPCFAVRAGPRRPEGGVLLTPFLAGPGLRALLASEPDAGQPARVLAEARRLVAHSLGGRAASSWSLLDLYDGPRERAALAHPSLAAAVSAAPGGLLVTDAAGRWLGLEHVGLEGEAGELLLRRLLHGYQVEALRRAPAPEALHLDEVLGRLRTSGAALREPAPDPGTAAPGVLRAVLDARDDAALGAEVLRVDGRRVQVSVLPRR